MLGEDHSLLKEFPEYKDTIAKLINVDDAFAKSRSQVQPSTYVCLRFILRFLTIR